MTKSRSGNHPMWGTPQAQWLMPPPGGNVLAVGETRHRQHRPRDHVRLNTARSTTRSGTLAVHRGLWPEDACIARALTSRIFFSAVVLPSSCAALMLPLAASSAVKAESMGARSVPVNVVLRVSGHAAQAGEQFWGKSSPS